MDPLGPVSSRLLAQQILQQLERVEDPQFAKEMRMLRRLLWEVAKGRECAMARLVMASYHVSSERILGMIEQTQPARPVKRRRRSRSGSGKRRKVGLYQLPPEEGPAARE